MTPRVREILSWYGAENPGVLTQLSRVFSHGKLGGSGKLMIYSASESGDHIPGQNFGQNPDSFDPAFHFNLAIESGCNALIGPLGFVQAVIRDYAGEIPVFLQVDQAEFLSRKKSGPISSVIASVSEAVKLGCVGVSLRIYPGSKMAPTNLEWASKMIQQARERGLLALVEVLPKGKEISTEQERSLDGISYGVHLAAQLGAHIVMTEPSNETFINDEADGFYQKINIKRNSMVERTRHLVDSCFSGRRVIVVRDDSTLTMENGLENMKGLAQGGMFGGVVGRRGFLYSSDDVHSWINNAMEVFAGNGK